MKTKLFIPALTILLMPLASANAVYQYSYDTTYPVQMFGIALMFIGIVSIIIKSFKEWEGNK